MKPLYDGPILAARGSSTSPEAVGALFQLGAKPYQVTAYLVDLYEAHIGPAAAAACRSADLDGVNVVDPTARQWVKLQLAKRSAYLRDKVLPQLRQAGRSATLAQVEAWLASAEALAE